MVSKGWVCPNCGRVIAPWVSECFACNKTRGTFASSNITNEIPNPHLELFEDFKHFQELDKSDDNIIT